MYITITPYNTEKTNVMSANGYYAFKVSPNANKVEIQKSIKDRYAVDVLDVKIVNSKPKSKYISKGTAIKRKTFKKAYVKFGKDVKFDAIKIYSN